MYFLPDVCGSKYNDDPFEEQKGKADDWDEMKKRIQALVDSNEAKEKAKAGDNQWNPSKITK